MSPTMPLSPDRKALLYGSGSGPLHLIRLWLAGLLRRPAGWWRQRQDRRALSGLLAVDDRQLADIGLTGDDIQMLLDRPVIRRRKLTIRLDRQG